MLRGSIATILFAYHSACTTGTKALANLATLTECFDAVPPELVLRSQRHLELASDQACGSQTLLERFRIFLFWESECKTHFGGVFLAGVQANKPRALFKEVSKLSNSIPRSEYDLRYQEDDVGGGGGTYQNARAKKRLTLMTLDDRMGCAYLKPPYVAIKLR